MTLYASIGAGILAYLFVAGVMFAVMRRTRVFCDAIGAAVLWPLALPLALGIVSADRVLSRPRRKLTLPRGRVWNRK
jgi:hypothetical protein